MSLGEKAFKSCQIPFQKLAELLEKDQFELVAVNDEKILCDQKVASESAEEMAKSLDG